MIVVNPFRLCYSPAGHIGLESYIRSLRGPEDSPPIISTNSFLQLSLIPTFATQNHIANMPRFSALVSALLVASVAAAPGMVMSKEEEPYTTVTSTKGYTKTTTPVNYEETTT